MDCWINSGGSNAVGRHCSAQIQDPLKGTSAFLNDTLHNLSLFVLKTVKDLEERDDSDNKTKYLTDPCGKYVIRKDVCDLITDIITEAEVWVQCKSESVKKKPVKHPRKEKISDLVPGSDTKQTANKRTQTSQVLSDSLKSDKYKDKCPQKQEHTRKPSHHATCNLKSSPRHHKPRDTNRPQSSSGTCGNDDRCENEGQRGFVASGSSFTPDYRKIEFQTEEQYLFARKMVEDMLKDRVSEKLKEFQKKTERDREKCRSNDSKGEILSSTANDRKKVKLVSRESAEIAWTDKREKLRKTKRLPSPVKRIESSSSDQDDIRDDAELLTKLSTMRVFSFK